MVVVLRERGLRVVIYRDDHDPPHVHVFGDGETKIELANHPDAIRIVYVVNATVRERRRVERVVRDNHAALLARWNDLHG